MTARGEAASSARVLIVEDDADVRQSLSEVMQYAGYEVAGAADGIEAIAYLQETRPLPDVILLDLMMPRMDGFRFREIQREVGGWSDIPVIVLTAYGTPAHQLGDLKPDAYLRKPLSIATLLDQVKRVLDGKSGSAT